MITKQQLIEKCEGLHFKPVDETEWNLCVDKCKSVGVTPYFFDFEMKTYSYFKIRPDGYFARLQGCKEYFPAKEFLAYFEEDKMNIEEKDGDYTIQFKEHTEPKIEKLSRKNYLLNRVKQIEANRKECIARMESEIESLQKEMTCLYCYVDEFGYYLFEKTKLYKYEAKAVTEFINRMEADFE